MDTDDIDRFEQDLNRLKREVQQKKLFLETAELTIRRAEETLARRQNSTAFKCTEYGYSVFENKSYEKTVDTVPKSALKMGIATLLKEVRTAIHGEDTEGLSPEILENRAKIKQLKLSNDAIWAREKQRPPIKAPWVIKAPYLVLCLLLDKLFESNPMSRFYFLETVARMPYFSYITMLHTYETLGELLPDSFCHAYLIPTYTGWYRRSPEAKRVHFAEELNEYHHLLIMESLGGDKEWRVRFLAQHASIVYYFVLIIVWVLSPSLAYNFSELIEAHAVDTYTEFAESNKELMMSMPPPVIAKKYYEADDMYVFDEFQTARAKGSRRPKIGSLYDVFCNIRDDEAEHVSTMAACQDPAVIIRSPNTEAAIFAAAAVSAVVGALLSGNIAAVDDSGLSTDAVQGLIQGLPL